MSDAFDWTRPDERVIWTVHVTSGKFDTNTVSWIGYADDADGAAEAALRCAEIARRISAAIAGGRRQRRPDVVKRAHRNTMAWSLMADLGQPIKVKVPEADARRIKHLDEGANRQIETAARDAASAALACAIAHSETRPGKAISVKVGAIAQSSAVLYGAVLKTGQTGRERHPRMPDPLRDALCACSIALWLSGSVDRSNIAGLSSSDSATLHAATLADLQSKARENLATATRFLSSLGLDDVAAGLESTYGGRR